MLSYWEQQSFINYDHIVIGSGIVGLSTAIELKVKYPKSSVLVLERSLLPTGASSRNAGFACMGSLTELLDDLQYSSEQEVVALYDLRRKGLLKLRERLGDDRIGYKANGSYELLNEHELEALDRLDDINALLKDITGQTAFSLANEKKGEFGFSKEYTKALIQNNCEGELHTGKMLRALIDYAMMMGVEIKTGADVQRFYEHAAQVDVVLEDAVRGELILSAGKLFVCTNAFTKQLLPDEDVVPGRGQVLITEPVKDLRFKGVYHFDKGYYYFREIDGRILFGGGRNKDFTGETTTALELNDLIQNDLAQKLAEIILPDTPFVIEQRWSGIMAFGANKQPIVKQVSNNIYGAFRMGGMGVAIGSEVGAQLVNLLP